jgi:hypothetical protein
MLDSSSKQSRICSAPSENAAPTCSFGLANQRQSFVGSSTISNMRLVWMSSSSASVRYAAVYVALVYYVMLM